MKHAANGTASQVANPAKFLNTAVQCQRASSMLGERTKAVLRERWVLNHGRMGQFRQEQVI